MFSQFDMFNPSIIEYFTTLKTPFYYYDTLLLDRTLKLYQQELERYDFRGHYALKANANREILKRVKEYNLGADCVSGGELQLALECGFDRGKIVFAGVGKSDWEIELAIENEIFSINCESIPELKVVDSIAAKMNRRASVSLRINPDIEANTHHFITTGRAQNKFGIVLQHLPEAIDTLKQCNNIDFIGLHFHIGSQICDLTVFQKLIEKVNDIVQLFNSKSLYVRELNMGGGLGVDYQEPDLNPIADFSNYFSLFNRKLKVDQNQRVHFEPGRALVAQSGSLISKVLFVKRGVQRDFVILDAGMNDFMRVALYQSYHKIENLSSTKALVEYDVAGPVCESSDLFGSSVALPAASRGDLVTIRSTGAYGQVMAMQYNMRERAPEIYSHSI